MTKYFANIKQFYPLKDYAAKVSYGHNSLDWDFDKFKDRQKKTKKDKNFCLLKDKIPARPESSGI